MYVLICIADTGLLCELIRRVYHRHEFCELAYMQPPRPSRKTAKARYTHRSCQQLSDDDRQRAENVCNWPTSQQAWQPFEATNALQGGPAAPGRTRRRSGGRRCGRGCPPPPPAARRTAARLLDNNRGEIRAKKCRTRAGRSQVKVQRGDAERLHQPPIAQLHERSSGQCLVLRLSAARQSRRP
jgi:hypothetical protein